MGQHTIVLEQDTTQPSPTHYSLIPSRKWLTKLYLHAAAEAMPAAVVSFHSVSRN